MGSRAGTPQRLPADLGTCVDHRTAEWLEDRAIDIAPQIRKISGEINHILATLGGSRDSSTSGSRPQADGELAYLVKEQRATRRRRAQFFELDLFADPAWDILLELFIAHLEQRRVAISAVCAAVSVPTTTALRWIKVLTARGLVVRNPDFRDARRIFVELSPTASRSMRGYFDGGASSSANRAMTCEHPAT